MRFLDSLSGNLKSKIQNRKWLGIVAIGVTFAMCGVVAQAQQPKKITRIGYLSMSDAATDSARSEAIRLALRELGYIEGQSIATVSGGDIPTRAAKNATKTILIVMVNSVLDPVEEGLVEVINRGHAFREKEAS
jgi:hypothetical protein